MTTKLSEQQIARLEAEWQEYWKQYCINNPDADGADYADEKEAFYEGN